MGRKKHRKANRCAQFAKKTFKKVRFMIDLLGTKVPTLKCSHHFHTHCLKGWIKKKN